MLFTFSMAFNFLVYYSWEEQVDFSRCHNKICQGIFLFLLRYKCILNNGYTGNWQFVLCKEIPIKGRLCDSLIIIPLSEVPPYTHSPICCYPIAVVKLIGVFGGIHGTMNLKINNGHVTYIEFNYCVYMNHTSLIKSTILCPILSWNTSSGVVELSMPQGLRISCP